MYRVTKVKRLVPTLTVLNGILAAQDADVMVSKLPLTKDYCESYGSRTEVYFRVKDMATRWALTRTLEALGIDVDRRYCTTMGNCPQDDPRMAVRVSRLKAHGWND